MKIGLIGDRITDIYIYGKMTRFSPESPIPIFDIISQEERDGGASNVNNNLLKLGANVHYYFDKVDYSIKKRYVCDNHIMFRCDEDKFSNIDPSCAEVVFDEEIKYVILSDYGKGFLKDPYRLVQRLKKEGKIVIVDPKKDLKHYKGANIVKMNEKEYSLYCPMGAYGRRYYDIETFVVTMGGNGVKIINDEGETIISGHDIQVSDVTGAGDIFIAVMTYYLAKGKNIYNACELANKLASLSVGHFGTYTLTTKDILSVEKKIVFTNGCFDILHKGHIEYLRESKKLGDKLIIGLNSDASIKRLKGSSRPTNNEQDRKHVLEALEFVDEVIIFNEDTPYELIRRIQPDIITKGGDYKSKEEVVGHDLADVVIISYLEGYSTTKTLERLNADC
jgi:D-beta-D-heptose 7-phosphate kinase/D-beta-D-heptose 1-phosphate adenosyltransferase